jgi:hypothetical protein
VANQVWRRQWVKGAPGSVPFPSQVVTALGDYVLSVNGREGTITLKPGTNVTIVETPPGSGIFIISASGGSGGVVTLGVTAPIVNTGTATNPVLGLTNPLAVGYGGTGTATPAGVSAGSGIAVAGSFPAQTVSAAPLGGVFKTLAQGLFAHYYNADEASGATLTDSGFTGGANGGYSAANIVYNALALRNDGVGRALINALTGYVTIPDNTNTTAWTMMAVMAVSPQTNSTPVLWSSTTDAGVHGFQLYMTAGPSGVTFLYGNGVVATSVAMNTVWPTLPIFGLPMIFFATYAAATGINFYVNGMLAMASATLYVKSGNANIWLGAYQVGPADGMLGGVGCIGLTPSVLTQAQMFSLVNAQRLG